MKKLFFILLNLISLSSFSQQQKIGPEFGDIEIRGGLIINNVPTGDLSDSILTMDSTRRIRWRTAGSITTPTPTIEQVLNAGSSFASSHTIDANDFNFAINDVNVFEVKSGDDTYVGAIAAWAVDVSGSAQYSQSAAGIGTRIIASPTKSFMESFSAGDTSYVRVNTNGSIRLYDAGGIFFESMLNTDATKFLTLNASGQLVLVTPSAGTSGTVTSVGLVAPAIFTVSGSPVTTSGNLTLSLATQTAGKGFMSPAAATGVPTFRLFVATDIPTLTASKISNFVATVRTSISLAATAIGTSPAYNNSTGVISLPIIPAQFNPVAGTNVTISGTYPNITFNAAGGGGGSVSSVALTVPSAFNVSGSPITTSGTFAITGAGTTAQYVNGAGGLTTFPTIPAQFNLIAGTNITTSGTYPNITVNASGAGGTPSLQAVTDVGSVTTNTINVRNLSAANLISLNNNNGSGGGYVEAFNPTNSRSSRIDGNGYISFVQNGFTGSISSTLLAENVQLTFPASANSGGLTVIPISVNGELADATGNITISTGGGSGTVTNVAVSGSDGIGVSGSPITTSGTIALSLGAITPTSIVASGLLSATLVAGSPTINLGDINAIGNSTTIKVDDNISRYIFSKRGFDIGGIVLAFPAAQGAANTFLKNDGTGNLTWATTGGGSGTVTSVGLTSSDITVGGTSPITTSGTFTLTLPTVNSNVGTFTHATLTVNAKGQVTAASSGSVPAQFNPIEGSGMTITGTYPNVTFSASQSLTDVLTVDNATGLSAEIQGFVNTGFTNMFTRISTTGGSAYTVVALDSYIYSDGNILLPASTTGINGTQRVLVLQNQSAGSINIVPVSGETLLDKGGVTYTNASPLILTLLNQSVTVMENGTAGWKIISRN